MAILVVTGLWYEYRIVGSTTGLTMINEHGWEFVTQPPGTRAWYLRRPRLQLGFKGVDHAQPMPTAAPPVPARAAVVQTPTPIVIELWATATAVAEARATQTALDEQRIAGNRAITVAKDLAFWLQQYTHLIEYDFAKADAENALFRARAETENNDTEQAAMLRGLLPEVEDAIAKADRVALSRLVVELKRIE